MRTNVLGVCTLGALLLFAAWTGYENFRLQGKVDALTKRVQDVQENVSGLYGALPGIGQQVLAVVGRAASSPAPSCPPCMKAGAPAADSSAAAAAPPPRSPEQESAAADAEAFVDEMLRKRKVTVSDAREFRRQLMRANSPSLTEDLRARIAAAINRGELVPESREALP